MPTDCGTLTVVSQFDPAAVTTNSCASLPSEAAPGSTITLDTTVVNSNDAAASAEVHVLQDGSSIGTQTVSIPGGNQSTISFDVELPTQTGDYSYSTEVRSATQA